MRTLVHLSLLSLMASVLALPTVSAQVYGGGAQAPNGKFVKLDLESWIPGTATSLRFVEAPATTTAHIIIVSVGVANATIPGFNGTLIADLTGGRGFFTYTGATLPVTLPASLAAQSLVLQGAVIDRNGQGYFTDAVRIDFFNPFIMVGNSRQSANSIQVVDLPTRAVRQKLTNSELGRITFSYDRKWAYVCEPGSRRDRVIAYDLTGPTVVARSTISVSPGIRYKCVVNRAGTRMYVPISTGISVVDTNPASPNFHREIAVIPTPITGSSSTIFTGPMSVALGAADTKLYIAYGENSAYPAKATVGVIDLFKTGTPHRVIRVNSGGTFIGLATRMDIIASPDGAFVYALEWGVLPAPPFTLGYANGGVLNVIDTAADREVKTLATGGYYAQELCVDRLGRNVWVAQLDRQKFGALLRVDVDRRSSRRFTVRRTIRIGSASTLR